MAVPTTLIKLSDIRAELSLPITSTFGDCIAAAGKTGVWDKFSDFAGYSFAYLTLAPLFMSFGQFFEDQLATVLSNTTWSVSDDQSWISISGASNSGDDIFTVTCSKNLGLERFGTVTVTWSGGIKTINITQADGSP